MSALRISNKEARWLWLERHGLAGPPTGELDVAAIAEALGFVQLDSIRHIERAHDHIVWSRNQSYRVGGLDKALRSRALFEHFTHDASLIPMRFLPMWRRQFARMAEQIVSKGWFKGMPDEDGRAELRARISREGALSTRDFDSDAPRPKGMWQRPPHKLGLDFMWYRGELATCHRKGFVKHYDLAERVFPEALREQNLSEPAQIDWLCRAALERLGAANAGEIMRFWDACSLPEVKGWLADHAGELIEVKIEGWDGREQAAVALSGFEGRLEGLSKPSDVTRILNPFDPAIRDRKRTERLFGFAYRNEIFVPEAKREYGYYIYPILQGDKLIARAELKPDRAAERLNLERLWPETHVKWSAARQAKLEAELRRFARFAGLTYESGSV